jgi:dTDP-3-amino-3,4,6-trideoxy-alpha-D-glucose transaminase
MTAPIPRADLRAQREAIAAELDDAVARVLASGRYILGAEVEAFEHEFAAYCGAAHCVTTASGTDALRLTLTASGIGPGDEVVTVAHTAPATVFAVALTGAEPVLVDIDPHTFTMDAGRAAEAIGPRTRALLPVSLYGRPAEMAALRRLADEHGLRLIEDAAQAHGARAGGRRAGTLGDAGCFSFYPTKNLGGYGDGGAVVTDDAQLAEQLRLLRDYGRAGGENHHVRVAGNSRLDELQAAILRVKLPRLDGWNAARRARAATYARCLEGLPLSLPDTAPDVEHAFHLYVVRSDRRDALQAHLAAAGIGTGIHYPVPVHRQPALAGRPPRAPLPATERAAAEILSLPMFPELRDADVERVATAVRAFLQR